MANGKTSASAATAPMLNRPVASPRRSGGDACTRISMTSGCGAPAAKPCRTRPKTMKSMAGLSPPTTLPETARGFRASPSPG